MREIVLDTETTGLDPAAGHRLIEIGCLELANHVPSGRSFQTYLNPEREVPAEAVAIHGLSLAELRHQPRFADIAPRFLDFIGDAKLVIHNAAFDLAFLNAELGRIDLAAIPLRRAIDTLEIARRKYPGAPASLDALCKRFGIDNSERETHGALLDAELLARVYIELLGGRQPALGLGRATVAAAAARRISRQGYRAPRPHRPSAEEAAAHAAFLDKLKAPVWRS